jgi:hypothetical protein
MAQSAPGSHRKVDRRWIESRSPGDMFRKSFNVEMVNDLNY